MAICPEKEFTALDNITDPDEKLRVAITFRNQILRGDAKVLLQAAEQLAESGSESFKARVIKDTNMVLEYYKPLLNSGEDYDCIIIALRFRNSLLIKKFQEKVESTTKVLDF